MTFKRFLAMPMLVMALTACGASPDNVDRTDRSTIGALQQLRGSVSSDEPAGGALRANARDAGVIVVGPVVKVSDKGSLDSGSRTHRFGLTIQVQEVIKGKPKEAVEVRTIGVGNADELTALLSEDAGIWILDQVEGQLVPHRSTSVVFAADDGTVVAPLAEAGAKPEGVTRYSEALEQARANSDR